MRITRQGLLIGAMTSFSAVALLASSAAQRSAGQGPPMYNVASEVTLSGTIDEVKTMAGPGGQGGIHLALKTTSETIQVDVGPSWFLTQQKYTLAKGDAIAVTGSRVKSGGAEHVIARQIKKGDQTMMLRDEKGFPKWSGRGRRD